MAQGLSDTILVAIRITLWIWESKVRNPDPPDRRRFVLCECILVVSGFMRLTCYFSYYYYYTCLMALTVATSLAWVGLSVVCVSVCLSTL